MSIEILVPLLLPLPLNVKVNAGRRSILGDLLAINQHFKFSYARPLHAAHRLGGFGNGILSGFGEALFGRTHNLDDFLGHGCLLSSNQSISLPPGTKVRIKISYRSESLEALGRVAFVRPNVGMGIFFTRIAPHDQLVLDKWIAELRDQYSPPSGVV